MKLECPLFGGLVTGRSLSSCCAGGLPRVLSGGGGDLAAVRAIVQALEHLIVESVASHKCSQREDLAAFQAVVPAHEASQREDMAAARCCELGLDAPQ